MTDTEFMAQERDGADLRTELAQAATHLPAARRIDPSTLSTGELRILTALHPAACGCVYHVELRRRELVQTCRGIVGL